MIESQPGHITGEKQITPTISLTGLSFVSGDSISLAEDDVVIVVGPNNAGKTALIRAIDEKLQNSGAGNPVLDSLTYVKRGELKDLQAFITRTAMRLHTSPPGESNLCCLWRDHAHQPSRELLD